MGYRTKQKGVITMTKKTEVKPINSNIVVNESTKTITVYSEQLWNTMLQSKEIKGHSIDTITDNTGKTKDGYFVISHFTHTAKATSKKGISKTVQEKKESKKAVPVNKDREIRLQEVVSSNAYITLKTESSELHLAEIPTCILDIALILKRKEKATLIIDKSRKDYFLSYVKGYAKNKVQSYNRNCTLAGKENMDNAIKYILSMK
jgi:hypothetical protein